MFLYWTRVWLLLICISPVATAQQFVFGGSLSGLGNFGSGLFNAGLPGELGASARVEWLDGFAKGFSVRADLGTRGLEAGVMWRLDLSQTVYVTINIAFAWLEFASTGLVGRFGLEYRFAQFAVALEYGWQSRLVGLKSSWLLSFLWFA